MSTFGPVFSEARDGERLKVQSERLLKHLRAMATRGAWQTIRELCVALENQHPGVKFPEPSISAQCRNLRKKQHGSHDVRGRYRTKNLYEYKLFVPVDLQKVKALLEDAPAQGELLAIPAQHYREDAL